MTCQPLLSKTKKSSTLKLRTWIWRPPLWTLPLQGACCPVGYHKRWLERDIFKQGFEETFESEVGAQHAQWLKMAKAAVRREAVVSILCALMQITAMLSRHFGLKHKIKVTFGDSGVFLCAISYTSTLGRTRSNQREPRGT